MRENVEEILERNGNLETERDVVLLPESWKKSTVDYAVYRRTGEQSEKIPFAFCVCTSMEHCPIDGNYAKKMLRYVLRDSVAQLGLVIDRDCVFVYRTEAEGWSKYTEKNEIEELITGTLDNVFNESDFRIKFLREIEGLIATKEDEDIAKILKPLIEKRTLKDIGGTVSFDFKTQFDLIAAVMRSNKVEPFGDLCRYSSIHSLHRMIAKKQESMCGLAGMNDKSEGFYLDYCLTPNSTFDISRKPQSVVDNYNKAFITSLCDIRKEDDLTMWRLYGGDDGDGVCLIYEADRGFLKTSDNFILAPVLYGDKDNILVRLFRFIEKLPAIDGFRFVMKDKDVWSYFVKSEGFKIEEEYRLLYIERDDLSENMKWINNTTSGIVHPIIEFNDLEKYPLKLKKIVLGPKCRERGVNRVQLKSWLNSVGRNIEVVESSIKAYR